MIELKIYSIHDQKAQAYITPFFLTNDAMAIRSFTDCVNDPGHQFAKNPSDYTLVKLGSFEVTQGLLESTGITVLAQGHELVLETPNLKEVK